jgi:hypothetical protein
VKNGSKTKQCFTTTGCFLFTFTRVALMSWIWSASCVKVVQLLVMVSYTVKRLWLHGAYNCRISKTQDIASALTHSITRKTVLINVFPQNWNTDGVLFTHRRWRKIRCKKWNLYMQFVSCHPDNKRKQQAKACWGTIQKGKILTLYSICGFCVNTLVQFGNG